MAGSVNNPDTQIADTHLDGRSCMDLAQDKANEYAATARFIGLLAGIGEQKDVDDARALVKRLIEELGVPTTLRQAADAEQATSRDKIKAENDYRLASIMHGQDSPQAQQALVARNQAGEAAQEAYDQRTALMHQSFKDFWSNLWSSLVNTYNSIIKSFEDGTWKVGLCKISVDAGFALLETGFAAALTAIGMGAAAYFLKIVGKVVEKGRSLVTITVKASRNMLKKKRVEAMIGKADAQANFHRTIDVNKELTDAEKRALGEENMGGPGQDPKHGEVDNNGREKPNTVGNLDWKKELKDRGVTDADIALAGSAGTSNAHREARTKLINAYADAYKGDAANLTGGTSLNLNKPVSVKEINKGDKMFQWNGEGRPAGNWVDPTNGGDFHGLGIAPYGREGSSVEFNQPAHGLLGTGAKAGNDGDTWTTKSSSFDYQGGGPQLYVPNKMKPAISLDSSRPKVSWRDAIKGNEEAIARSTKLKPNWEDELLNEAKWRGWSDKTFSDIVDFYNQHVVKPP